MFSASGISFILPIVLFLLKLYYDRKSDTVMLKVYVISARNLPAADANGLSDPYVKIYSVDHNKFRFARTQTIQKTINPVFDKELNQPFLTPFVRTKTILFEVFDSDKISSDSCIGTAEFDLLLHPIGQPVTLDVDTAKPQHKRPAKLVVQVDYPIISTFSLEKFSATYHSISMSLDFNPPLIDFELGHSPTLSFILINYKKKFIEVGKPGVTPPYGIRFDNSPQHLGPSGFTQVIRCKISSLANTTIIPIVKNGTYHGVITVNYTMLPKEQKKDGCRRVDNVKEVPPATLGSSSYKVIEDQLYTLGSALKINKTGTSCELIYFDSKVFEDKVNPSEIATIIKKNYANYWARITIAPGANYSLNEVASQRNLKVPKKITFGLGWQAKVDLDCSAFIIGKEYTVIEMASGKTKGKIPYVKHSGDAKSSKSESDAETIIVNLEEVPDSVKAIALCGYSNEGSLSNVRSVYMRALDEEGNELVYLPIEGKKAAAVLFAIIFRGKNNQWELCPLSRQLNIKKTTEITAYINDFFYISGVVEDVIMA